MGTELFVIASKSHVNAEGPHISILREFLQVVTKLLCKNRDRNEVTVLELVLGGCLAEPHDDELGIVHIANKHCADVVIDRKDVGD